MFARIRPGLSVVIAWLLRALRHDIRFAVRLTTRQPGMLVGVLAIVILWSGVLYAAWAERQHAIDDAFDNTDSFARAFQEQVTGTVRAIDQTLRYVRAAYIRAPDQFDITRWSQGGEFLIHSTFQLAIIARPAI